MHKTTIVSGSAAPLKRSNVDTDQIIPAVFLKRVTKTGFEDALFFAWRQDPEFVLNQPAYQGAKVLVAGPDFGTGSSREHAVWALRDFGFEVVLSPRFGDIFRGNAGKQGLLAAVVDEPDIEKIWALIDESVAAGKGSPEITVDLPEQTVMVKSATGGGLTVSFEVDAYTKWRLLEGLDDIALTLRDESAITEFESRRANWRPKTLPVK
jgi:3-isopropylmalate/(R)-2-methylmalate dehydratase small subunit